MSESTFDEASSEDVPRATSHSWNPACLTSLHDPIHGRSVAVIDSPSSGQVTANITDSDPPEVSHSKDADLIGNPIRHSSRGVAMMKS